MPTSTATSATRPRARSRSGESSTPGTNPGEWPARGLAEPLRLAGLRAVRPDAVVVQPARGVDRHGQPGGRRPARALPDVGLGLRLSGAADPHPAGEGRAGRRQDQPGRDARDPAGQPGAVRSDAGAPTCSRSTCARTRSPARPRSCSRAGTSAWTRTRRRRRTTTRCGATCSGSPSTTSCPATCGPSGGDRWFAVVGRLLADDNASDAWWDDKGTPGVIEGRRRDPARGAGRGPGRADQEPGQGPRQVGVGPAAPPDAASTRCSAAAARRASSRASSTAARGRCPAAVGWSTRPAGRRTTGTTSTGCRRCGWSSTSSRPGPVDLGQPDRRLRPRLQQALLRPDRRLGRGQDLRLAVLRGCGAQGDGGRADSAPLSRAMPRVRAIVSA